VRFMREIAQDDRLCVVQRGHRSVIDTFFDHGVEGNLWSSNIIDICPVGALLSKDFLHKARAWDLDSAPSICPNCSQGCNIKIDTRDNLAMRLKPRTNSNVNSYWMCDYGRYRYEWLNRSAAERGGGMIGPVSMGGDSPAVQEGREAEHPIEGYVHERHITAPMIRRPGTRFNATTWQAAILALVERLREIREIKGRAPVHVIASPMFANEDVGLLARLLDVLGGGAAVYRSPLAEDEVVCPGFPKLARRRELAANGRGLQVFGYKRVGDDTGAGGITSVDGKVVIVLGDELHDQSPDFGRDALLYVYMGDVLPAAARNAHVILPVSSFAEQEGTFTNFEGRVQRFWPALQAPPLARPAWQILGVILAGLDDALAPASAAAAFLRLGDLYNELAGLSYEVIGARGALMNDAVRIAAGAGAAR
jgi:NADH-quinone oxidoreductase subunit G